MQRGNQLFKVGSLLISVSTVIIDVCKFTWFYRHVRHTAVMRK